MEDGTAVETSWGVTYDLNDNTSIGWDSALGMMMYFDAPAGVTLRLGWTAAVAGFDAPDDEDGATDTDDDGDAFNDDNGFAAQTSIGLGYTWWIGGTGLKTSISTNYDYVMAPCADGTEDDDWNDDQLENSSNLSVVIGFGF